MSIFDLKDDPKDLKDQKTEGNSKTEVKGYTKNDAIDKIDKEYNTTNDAMRALQAKKELENNKYDENHKIGLKSKEVIRQSAEQELDDRLPIEKEVDIESFFADLKRLRNDLPAIKERHKYTDEEYKEMGREFILEELQEKLPELFNGKEQLIFMNKDGVYIDEEVFDSLSKDKQDLLEKICIGNYKPIYINSYK